MSAFTLSKVSAVQTRGAYCGQTKRRWIHGSLKRQATIMMPAMSPLMTEGTVTRWRKKEGEAFVAGDVLLQIESDIAMIDVEACNPGILVKILTPDGTSNVQVEQVIALAARNMDEFALLQNQSIAPRSPLYTESSPARSSTPVSSPRRLDFFQPLVSPRTPSISSRKLSLFEMHAMGYGRRSAHVGGPHGTLPKFDMSELDNVDQNSPSSHRIEAAPLPSPCIPIRQQETSSVYGGSPNANWPGFVSEGDGEENVSGAAVRRMIVSNLARSKHLNGIELDDFLCM